MALRRLTAALLAALILAGCGGPEQPATAVFVPTSAATPPPAPTQAPAPTGLPQPTAPEPTTAPAATAAPTSAPAPTAAPAAAAGEELLFLREHALIAFDLATRKERTLAGQVLEFAAAPDGRSIALVRDLGKAEPASGIDLWLVRRDGAGLRQLTNDSSKLIEATPAWAPDGAALAYAASAASGPYARTWEEWSAWCRPSEVHVLDLSSGADRNFGPGCDPAFSPDGKRIAYATPPSARQDNASVLNAANAIRLINRQGQNGWSFATAAGTPDAPPAKRGLLVYAPAFSPNGQQLTYQRFLGYQALVDLAMTEIGGSFEGKGLPLNAGAGWILPARFAPDGTAAALVENNYGDARGFGGYDNWSVTVLRLTGTHDIALPEGTLQGAGQLVDRLPRAQSAAWSPDGPALAVLLPPGWKPNLPPDQPVGADERPGEIWRWQPGSAPAEKLAANVDFASPVLWLPAVQ
jgi:hypothetical protein